MPEGLDKNEYNPKLGDANRYENSRFSNKELAEKINQEVLSMVKTDMPVLEKLEKNPGMKDFHDPITGSKWAGEYLLDEHKKILELYGVTGVSSLEEPHASGVPREVVSFLKRIYSLTYKPE